MSYRVDLFRALTSIEWSQAVWKLTDGVEELAACRAELLHDAVLAHLPREGLIVDAGAGTGRWVRYLRARGHRCIGFDISVAACLRAKAVDRTVPLAAADTRSAPLPDAAADVVLSFGVVEHEEDGPAESLRELRRIVKPNGLLVLAVPFDNLVRRLLVNRLMSYVTWRRRRAGWPLGFAEYRFSRREMKRLLQDAGFTIVGECYNDLVPPLNMGLWVDYNNLTLNPFRPSAPQQLLTMPPRIVPLVTSILRRAPGLIAGEIVLFARPAQPT